MSCARTPAIAILAYPGAQRSAVEGLFDLFQIANRVNASDGQIRFAPVIISDPGELSRQDDLSAVILPPSLTAPEDIPVDQELDTHLVRHHARGTLLCSVCAGAFVLARTGLLAGRQATTHWDLANTFTDHFPDVHLNTSKLILDQRDIITAGGLMAWLDLGLHLVARFAGGAAMNATARYLLVDPPDREQSYYQRFSPRLQHGDEAIRKAQLWMGTHLADPIRVSALSRAAAMSERSFLRRFKRATGYAPSAYLQRLRIDAARDRLETSNDTIDQIAWAIGYKDPSAFRRQFTQQVGITPSSFRRRFSLPN